MKRTKQQRLLAAALLLICLLTGCAKETAEQPQSKTRTVFAMDTVMDLTPYGENADAANDAAQARIMELESLFSVTQEGSDVYRVNHAQGAATAVSADTAALLASALEYCAETDGALDISIYPVLKAWGFTTSEYRVPGAAELSALLEHVDYSAVQFDGETVTLPADGMEIDLGSIAKGYTGDMVMQTFRDVGVTSGMVSLGGNVQTLGTKPDGSLWRIGIQDPQGDGLMGVISVADEAVITSGGYERYFEQDGVTYWHIIDPATGAPAHSGVISATVVGKSGTMCDALSTALFVMGPEKAADFWRSHGGFEYLLITEDGALIVSEGIADRFETTEAWSDAPLTVVTK